MSVKATPVPQNAGSIFTRIGGRDAIGATVELFYVRVLADPELQPFFTHTNMTWLKLRQAQFLAQVFGGPAEYKGKTMKLAHARREIEPRHFARAAQHLSDTLTGLKIANPLIGEVMTAVASLEPEIATKLSNASK